MGSVVSNMYGGFQYMLSCGGENQRGLENGGSLKSATPFVWKRTSSMYFDEDGDLAHEFYEEVKPSKKGKKFFMKKVTRRLLPQGLVDLPHPRLHVDFPVVMCETCY
ncbi:tumor suppressor candidate 2-like [Orbicella faveolata]|uniref:tumor suppressor candidate 2-like n=1 Tax=Orbicella faveolata TaxID=48498 RepID=UPI0009E4C8FF|nr:tumor suppressor candidate 2-like [Orbicella faveolata]